MLWGESKSVEVLTEDSNASLIREMITNSAKSALLIACFKINPYFSCLMIRIRYKGHWEDSEYNGIFKQMSQKKIL